MSYFCLKIYIMRYSRNQLNKNGEIYMKSSSTEERSKALVKINEWRTDHLHPLNELKLIVNSLLIKSEIKFFSISQRLKRISSIEYKLDINPDMRLGGLYDIGGLRVVLYDIKSIYETKELLSNDFENFEFIKINDYIDSPKNGGYRSIHLIYQYNSTNALLDKLRIELQIRTKLQHSWATALETVDIHNNTRLKSGYGDDRWMDFFKITSALFSYKEACPVIEEYRALSLEDIMKMYYKHNKSKNNISLLKAYKVSAESVENDDTSDFYLLIIDIEKRLLKIEKYDLEELDKASQRYYVLEDSVNPLTESVVLVNVDNYRELKEAYPSYFSDITEFIQALDKVEENCIRLNLK